MVVTNPGDIADVIRSTWPDLELSDAQERLYAEYLKDIDPDVLRGALVAVVADWDHPAPPGIITAAAGEQAKRTKRKKAWIQVGLAAGILVVVLGGILGVSSRPVRWPDQPITCRDGRDHPAGNEPARPDCVPDHLHRRDRNDAEHLHDDLRGQQLQAGRASLAELGGRSSSRNGRCVDEQLCS